MTGGKPLTIVLISDTAHHIGGQTKVTFDSAIGLKRAGHRPIVYSAVGPADPTLIAAGVEVVILGQHGMHDDPNRLAAAVRGLWNAEARSALVAFLADLPAETIVHCHAWTKGFSAAIASAIRASGRPAVYTLHDYFLFCPNGAFFDFPANRICRREPMSLACWSAQCDSRSYAHKLWRCVRQVVSNHVAEMATAFSDYICISAFQHEAIGHRLPKGAHLHRLSNPIEATDLGAKPDAATGDIVFVGRLSPEKGALVFAEAARKAGIVPVFVGDGPIAGEIAARFPEAKLLGWADPATVRARMRDARALVFPSLWFEGQPLTVMEAKAMGTPVIVSDACAGREEIVDGESGLWFSSGDVDDLARALKAVTDDDLVHRLALGAYESFWREPRDLARHVAGLEAIYREMLAR